MARIQHGLFDWQDVEGLDDLKRLELALSALPDEALMVELEAERGKGRDDYPVRAVWNSLLAGVVFGHESVESLRRELLRNAPLRQMCGFDPLRLDGAVPSSSAYSRFLRGLFDHEESIAKMFDDLIEELRAALPGFGRALAVDGKALPTRGRPRGEARFMLDEDGRRDLDADFGVKRRDKGTPCERVTKWFGYKLHLIVDAIYELPVAFEVTQASRGEQPVARKMLRGLHDAHPALMEEAEYLLGDRGYDGNELHRQAWRKHGLKPIVDARETWGKDEKLKFAGPWTNVFYNEEGEVFCCCPKTAEYRAMAYGGFEKERESQKWRCPARHYGYACPGMSRCAVKGAIRIPLERDRRVLTPLSRPHRDWPKLYARRTAVERVNSRLDVSFGFERHFIRGWKKMWLRAGLALIVMLAMALGRVRENQKEKLRSLVQAA
jgi:hypothetical protein